MSVERYELPDGWRWVKFGDVLAMSGGAQPPKSTFLYAPKRGYVRFLQIRDFGDREVPTYIKISDAPKTCEENDILIARYGASVGRILTGKKGAYNVAMGKVIFLNDELDRRFVYYLLQSSYFQEPIRQTSRTAQAGFNGNDIKPINIPLPPLPEQHHIVKKIESLFAEARTARAALNRAEPLLKKFRQAVLSAAFRGELTERDANDEPALALLERIRAERIKNWEDDLRAKGKDPTKAKFVEAEPANTRELGELPEGWEWASLDQSYELGRGRFSFRPRNEPRFFNGKYPFVQIGDLPDDGGEIVSYRQTLNEAGFAISKMFLKGTVLIAIVGATIGNSGILTFDSCVTDSLVAIRADDDVRLKFVEYYLRLKKWEIRESSYASGGQPNISLRTLAPFPIPLPPLAEQQRIIERIESLFAQAEQIERAVEVARRRAEKVEQAILARAFRGEL